MYLSNYNPPVFPLSLTQQPTRVRYAVTFSITTTSANSQYHQVFYLFVCLVTLLTGCWIAFLCTCTTCIHKVNEHLPGPLWSSFILEHLPDIKEYLKKEGSVFSTTDVTYSRKYGPVAVIFFVQSSICRYLRSAVYFGDTGGF